MNWKSCGITVSAVLALANAAYAQPASFTDLGTLSTGTVNSGGTMGGSAATNVVWFRFVVPTGVTSTSGWLDLTTNAGTPVWSNQDSLMGLYNSTGGIVTTDDDDGPGNYSEISKGKTSPTRTTISGALGGNGRDGALTAGTYWLAVVPYNATFAANWSVTPTTNLTVAGGFVLRLDYSDGLTPTNPTGVGSAAPTSAWPNESTNVLYKVTVTPGTNPPSTAHTVTVDMSGVGGSSTQQFYDDGTNGDVTAGDNIFSYAMVLGNVSTGAKTLPFTVQETAPNSRSSTGSIAFTVNTPTNPTGSGSSSAPFISGFAGHDTQLLKVTVTPGTHPSSTGTSVVVDMSSMGGSSTQQFYDDGTHGDVTAGDNIFSYTASVASGLTSANYAMPFTVADGQLRTSTGTVTANVQSLTDLGTLTLPQNITAPNSTVPTSTIAWYKFTIPSVSVADNNWLDIVTSATLSGGSFTNDTYMGLFSSSGAVVSSDDDDGPDALSALSYGLTAPTRSNGNGVAFNGRDGSLAAGTYYIAIGGYSCSFAANFVATSASNHTAGNTVGVSLSLNSPSAPTVACNSASALAGGSVLLTGTVTPGQNPASTGLTVVGNLSSIGGSATQTFYDDGTNGDVTAGDNIFSFAYTVPNATAAGSYNVPLTVSDSLSRSGTCTATVSVDEAGSTIATAKNWDSTAPITGVLSASDVDMFRIHICDPANFSAAISGATVSDTQIFLFSADGHGVAMDDDYPSGSLNTSTLTGSVVQSITAGDYYLAISSYDNDPVDSTGTALWADTPYDVVRAPDGPAAANTLDHWDNAGSNTGTYTINLTGVSATTCAPPTGSCCYNNQCNITTQAGCLGTWTLNGTCTGPSSCAPHCGSADFNCDGDTGTDLDIEAFFACIAGNCPPLPCLSSSDFNADGDVGTDADIEAFFRVLAGGNC